MKFKTVCATTIFLILILAMVPSSLAMEHPESQKQEHLKDPLNLENLAPWDEWIRDQDHNRIDDLLDKKISQGLKEKVNIYINYISRPTSQDLIKLKSYNFYISYIAKYISTVCARGVPLDIIPELSLLHRIAMIELQPFLVPALDVSAGSMKARNSVEYSPETAWELGYTGRNRVVAILDTGVDDRHEALDNKYIAGYDCTLRVPREVNPDDEDGHGTHCAGIVMGTGGEDGQYIGISPNARLVDVKVLNDLGLTPGDQIIIGIEWCIDVKDDYNIDVLSVSIGELFTGDDDGQGTQGRLVNTAVSSGLIVVVAAGNDGPNNDGFSSLAAADDAITVGALNEQETVTRNDDDVASFSNRGPRADDNDGFEDDELKPDVVAPGVDIMSALFSSTPIGLITGYQQMSGTSMACPHVAGLAALLLEVNPSLTPLQIKQVIKDTAEAQGFPTFPDIDPKYNKEYGFGSVDAYEAVKKIIGDDYQTVGITSHSQFEEVHNIVTISGTASVSKGNIDKVEYNINYGFWHDAEGEDEWSFQWDTTTVDNELNYVFVRSFDGIEYSKEFELPLKVVNIGAEFISPINGTTLKGFVEITGSSFGTNITNILIKIGDSEWEEVDLSDETGDLSKWRYNWNTKNSDNGNYIISVKAYNGKWFSIPISIEVRVKNESESSGFLPGFDWLLIILCLFVVIFINYRSKIRFKY